MIVSHGQAQEPQSLEVQRHKMSTQKRRALCTGTTKPVGGDITSQDGTGGKSIYGGKFEDESFEVRHTGPGLLSMANRGRDTNNSQFFITLKKAEHLDFKHVAFGFIKDGMDVVRRIGELGAKDGKPTKTITISDCGQIM